MADALQTSTSFCVQGGTFMWPLLVWSIGAVRTIILRTIALREENVIPLVVESGLERLVPGGSAERLGRVVHHDPSSRARLVRVALAHLRWSRTDTVEAVQTRARHEMVRLERGLVVLEVITGIAPLIGLIGTVSGLIHVFASLGLSAGAADAKRIALGISEALTCTIFGLGIAVPSLVGFVYFSKKVEVMSVEMESLITDLLSKLYFGRVSGEVPSAKQPPMPARAPVA